MAKKDNLEINRRTVIKILGLVLGSSIFPTRFVSAAETFQNSSSQVSNSGILTTAELTDLARLVDIIIPPSTTPGAKEAKVHDFINHMLTSFYSEEDSLNFKQGLNMLNNHCLHNHSKRFLELPDQTQTDTLNDLYDAVGKEKSFFDRILFKLAQLIDNQQDQKLTDFLQFLKEITIFGYYTSVIGATQELKYLPVPGAFKGCITFSDVGSSWAL